MEKATVSLVLDRRRIRTNGKYPVRLRLYLPSIQRKKLYTTIFEFTEKDFASIWETTKPRNEFKELRKMLFALEKSANDTIDSLKQYSFEDFESKFYGKTNTGYKNVISVFERIVKEKTQLGAISTAEKYELAKRCIQSYLDYKGKKITELTFDKINISFLKDLTYYCENIKNLSAATIGIYLRNLRSVYRIAISNDGALIENYPFYKDSFVIPSSSKVNKALTEAELKMLWNTEPENDKQALAKDFWFFSYYSYGMNTKDVCELRHSSIKDDCFHYVRAKTKNTKKERTTKEVPLTPSLLAIINRRKNLGCEYLFGIINNEDNPKQKHEKIKLFNRLINKHFRAFAFFAGIDKTKADQLGTYHARHSFATIAIRKGKSTALISEILHDGNLKVTENYINTFPKESFKELSREMEL